MSRLLEVKDVMKIYGRKGSIVKALDGITFAAEEGEFTGVMGASGSGKTTLLNCIATIDKVTAGSILVGGQDITRLKGSALSRFRRDTLGFIFQEFNLIDTLTARENIAMSLVIKKKPAAEIVGKVNAIADVLGISETLDKYPYQLSGGQKQRVAAARAVVSDPKLILADEPTGALDSRSSRQLLTAMEHLHKTLGTSILMVTHDAFTASYAQRIIFIKDGRIFTELIRGEDSRKDFFRKIIDVQTLLGGDAENVI